MELYVEKGALAGQTLFLEHPVVVIGRGGELGGERLALPDGGVSRQHARLQYGPQGWILADLGSTNGTYLNRQRLREHEPHLLRPGDRVEMGGAVLVVQQTEEPIAAAAEERQERRPHPALLVTGAMLLVVVLVGIVILLVVFLRPRAEVTTPTPGAQMDQIMTALPVPTEVQEMATAILPLIATELPLPIFGPASTPTPESALPRRQTVERLHVPSEMRLDALLEVLESPAAVPAPRPASPTEAGGTSS